MAKTHSTSLPKRKQGQRYHPPIEERLAKYTHKFTGPDACWIWIAARDGCGYGTLNFHKKGYKAHRFIYEREYGPIDRGMLVLHKCDVPSCVRPDHLFLGTNKDNKTDSVNKRRHAHGRRLPNATLDAATVLRIRELYATDRRYFSSNKSRGRYDRKTIAAMCNATYRAVDYVIGGGWKHV